MASNSKPQSDDQQSQRIIRCTRSNESPPFQTNCVPNQSLLKKLKPKMNKLCLLFFIICLLKSIGTSETNDGKRTLETHVNPDCDNVKCKSFTNDTTDLSVVYIRSSRYKTDKEKAGPDIHFILSKFIISDSELIVINPFINHTSTQALLKVVQRFSSYKR